MKKNDEGFTLIELLIVIVILGILATVVVFAVGGITDRGKKSACDADSKTLEVAVEAYYAQYGTAAGQPDRGAARGTPDFLRAESSNMGVNGSGEITIQDADCGTRRQRLHHLALIST